MRGSFHKSMEDVVHGILIVHLQKHAVKGCGQNCRSKKTQQEEELPAENNREINGARNSGTFNFHLVQVEHNRYTPGASLIVYIN